MFGVRWCDYERPADDPEHLPYATFLAMCRTADQAMKEAERG